MTTRPQLPSRTSIATGLAALALLGGAFGLAKSASAAAPVAPDHGALVIHHQAHAAVAGIRDNLEALSVEEGEARRAVTLRW
jgi:hypothetical protein